MRQQNFTEAIIGIQEKVEEIQSMVIEEPSIYRTFRNCIEYLEKRK